MFNAQMGFNSTSSNSEGMWAKLGKVGLLTYLLSSLLPLSKSNAWWIRAADFPRLQLLSLGIGFGGMYLATTKDESRKKALFLSALGIGAAFDFYRVFPYSRMWPRESLPPEAHDPSRVLSMITANVLQQNENSEKLLKLIQEKSPDIVLLLETNERWLNEMSSLESDYPYMLKQPLENEYGLVLYSRLPLEEAEIRYLVEPGIPSVSSIIVLPSGEKVHLFGVHPRPPRPSDGPTDERDAELIHVAKAAKASKYPALVMGDLNDVAWSHTTRLFRRISGLLDPRVGRQPFPTFPTSLSFLGFPLDYVFHSKSLRLVSIDRLKDVGSDHFPMYFAFELEPEGRTDQVGLQPDREDFEEARETVEQV